LVSLAIVSEKIYKSLLHLYHFSLTITFAYILHSFIHQLLFSLVPSEDNDDSDAVLDTPYIVKSFSGGNFIRGIFVEGDAAAKVGFTSQDFLGLGSDAAVKESAKKTLELYTVGSCGPRGFYGTTQKHLELETDIARFMHKDESITYSDSTATIASAIPAFAKRGDLLLIDSRANYGIMSGARLSRSSITLFRHNDLIDLRRKLEEVRERDKKSESATQARRFIVVEGLYSGTGDICPLDKIYELACEFKWRLICDDSWGFGVLGATGKGITEHFGKPASDKGGETQLLHVEILVGSLSTTLASVGGFCVGSREVVDHQRLSGQGYCFSASAPPFTCATAAAALKEMRDRPALLTTLRNKSKFLQDELAKSLDGFMVLTSDPISPIKHLIFPPKPREPVSPILSALLGGSSSSSEESGNKNGYKSSFSSSSSSSSAQDGSVSFLPSNKQLEREAQRLIEAEEDLLDRIVSHACSKGNVLISRSHRTSSESKSAGTPSIRVLVTALHTEGELKAVALAIKNAVKEVKGGK
jgi:serine palmitoyltransferase